jgi:hypothetical protein
MRPLVACLLISAFAACGDGSAEVELSVDLRTDFVAGVEFTGVRVELVGEDVSEDSLAVAESFVDGRRVADFVGLAPSERRTVAVSLVGPSGAAVARRTAVVVQDGDLAVTVVISRDCSNVTCDAVGGVADRCLGGRCVDPECVEGDEEACLEPQCTAASDCTPSAPCAEASCLAGVCLFDAGDSCGDGSYCDPDVGCRPTEPSTCEPALGEVVTLIDGVEFADEPEDTKPVEAELVVDGERVWAAVTNRFDSTGVRRWHSVLARIGCAGVIDPPRLVASSASSPTLAATDPPILSAVGDMTADTVAVIDRDTGAPERTVTLDLLPPRAALPSGDGIEVLQRELLEPGMYRYYWQPIDDAGMATGAPRLLSDDDPWSQGTTSVIGQPRIALAYLRSDPDGASNAAEGVTIWTESLGVVDLYEGAQTRATEAMMVWRGEDLWVAAPPRGNSAIEGIEGREIHLYRVSSEGEVSQHVIEPPAGFGDFIVGLAALGEDDLAIGWVRRAIDTDAELYMRRIDVSDAGITAGAERLVPGLEKPALWSQTFRRYSLASLPGDHVVVSWIEAGDDSRRATLRFSIFEL